MEESINYNELFMKAVQNNAFNNIKKLAPFVTSDFMGLCLVRKCKNIQYFKSYANHKTMEILLDLGANPNVKNNEDYDNTPLHYAVAAMLAVQNITCQGDPRVEFVERLLDCGGDPNIENTHPYKLSPWQDMIRCKNSKMIRKFLECGADYTYYINITDIEINWHFQTRRMLPQSKPKYDILTYKLCVLYNQMVETREKAINVVKQKFIDMYYQRCGGISIEMLC
jgi:hypothetical protein